MPKSKLCFITAVPITATSFLNAHIERLAADFDVFVVSDFSAGAGGVSSLATHIHAPIARNISITRDIAGLWTLFRIFRHYRFDIVHSVTPKAGLLAMTAGFMARLPVRIHWFTGQVWVTRQGFVRMILKTADRILAALATHLLADSPSQRDFLVAERVCAAQRIAVIGDGSICGVDTQRFRPDAEARRVVRARHGIPDDALLVLFLGRLNIDKGLREMAQAMLHLDAVFPQLHWLIVGPDEGGMVDHICSVAGVLGSRLHFQDFSREPEAYMAAADVFCLPSYREGFGSSVLEAAAAGVPSVASRIYGLIDAVEDGLSGLLVLPANPQALASALAELLDDQERCCFMGCAARERALEKFSRERVVEGLHFFYQSLLSSKGPAI